MNKYNYTIYANKQIAATNNDLTVYRHVVKNARLRKAIGLYYPIDVYIHKELFNHDIWEDLDFYLFLDLAPAHYIVTDKIKDFEREAIVIKGEA